MNSIAKWFRRDRLDQELAEEMQEHIEERTADLIRDGMSAPEARDQARREFGNTTALGERSRDVWSWPALDDFLRTLVHSARALRHGGAYTAVSIVTLALGIGANTAIFSLIDAVLLRPLPYQNPEQLIRAGMTLPGMSQTVALTREFVSYLNENHTFESLVAFNDEQYTLTRAGEPEQAEAATVTTGFLSALGVHPSLGRDFRKEEYRPGAPRVVLINDALWRRHWNASPLVLSQGAVLDDTPVQIVGVLPPGFRFPGDLRPDILAPEQLGDKPDWSAMQMGLFTVIGRLKPGVSEATAAADLSLISQRHKADKPVWLAAAEKDSPVMVLPLQTSLVGNIRPA